MSNTANITFHPFPPKPQTSREVIQQNVELLIEQLEAGHSEALANYLTAIGRFHNYSLGNILEVARQKPDATRVAGCMRETSLAARFSKERRTSAPLPR